MNKVLITARSAAHCGECLDLLKQNGCEVIDGSGDAPRSENEMTALITGVDAVIAGVDEVSAKVIAAGKPTLKVISRNGVGYNKVDVQAARANGVVVTLSLGTNNISVCELVFGLLLSVGRNIVRQNEVVRAGGWQRTQGIELFGKTLGVIGTGHIGTEVIKRAKAFGMRTLAFDLYPLAELSELYGTRYVSLEELYKEADMITLHVPATKATMGMINEEVLQSMKDSAIIINTARGDLVHEEALAVALKTGKIAGYGADTTVQEPPEKGHPFLDLPNVVITPHCGGYTREAVVRCSVTAAEEVLRVLRGEKPLFPVTH
ncbi:hypothetical protein P22_2267 [Propionispora sp. 2/2-37]|uniref:phosphoglycerate dehydrogenase n=1 Tax=Propionispora sp. 2/2-37 TaxID=1677858 RepID=UPI0006BB580D|nr:phosphoglycerate dehydrogenase [Propionispora sp. 2/2-37]CUH96178.1 hypothetical protein P22_2267 [Propionispora sp. 2/2-37]